MINSALWEPEEEPQEPEMSSHTASPPITDIGSARKAKSASTERASGRRGKSMSDPEWIRMATARGVRLPQHGTALTTGAMEHWLHKIEMPLKVYLHWVGFRSLRVFIEHNPDLPLRWWVGCLLEHEDYVWQIAVEDGVTSDTSRPHPGSFSGGNPTPTD